MGSPSIYNEIFPAIPLAHFLQINHHCAYTPGQIKEPRHYIQCTVWFVSENQKNRKQFSVTWDLLKTLMVLYTVQYSCRYSSIGTQKYQYLYSGDTSMTAWRACSEAAGEALVSCLWETHKLPTANLPVLPLALEAVSIRPLGDTGRTIVYREPHSK